MIAGFAEREYTPAEGFVPGQINVNYAKGKRTPLMAHVAVIESKGVGAVLIALDILFVSVDFAAKLRRRVSEITAFRPTASWSPARTRTQAAPSTWIAGSSRERQNILTPLKMPS